jgi:hypothetical protein
MKKFLRWFVLVLMAGIFLMGFLWEVKQPYSVFDHKVVEVLMIMVFFGFGWIWSGYDEISAYQEMIEMDQLTHEKQSTLADNLVSITQPTDHSYYILDDSQFIEPETLSVNEKVNSER